MEKIRVSRGVTIEVNDNGDTITMNADDQQFVEKFYGLIDKSDAIAKELGKKEMQQLSDHEQLKVVIVKIKELMKDIDVLFGTDSCKKIFGEIVPHPYLIADFFEQLKPIVKKHVDARQRKIAEKYNNKRKGSRNKYRNREELIQDAMHGPARG